MKEFSEERNIPFVLFEKELDGENRFVAIVPIDANTICVQLLSRDEYEKLLKLTERGVFDA